MPIDNRRPLSYNGSMRKSDRRTRQGALYSAVGILANLLLSAGKIAVGILCGAVSVTADGFNNLSDCGSGVIALVSFFIAEKPADREHPFGHRRAESIASMLTGFFVLLLAAELLREAVGSIVRGGAPVGTAAVWIVLGVSVAVKLGMFFFYRFGAKRVDSEALGAAATDSLCDCLATAAAALGAALSSHAPSADGWAAVLVSLFIVWQGVRISAKAASRLLGEGPDPRLKEEIAAILLSKEGILGYHDLRIYGYGKGASFATAHVEMDASLPALASHAVIDAAETEVRERTGVSLTVHLDPVDLANSEEAKLKEEVLRRACGLTEGLEVHDFRVRAHGRAEFDVGVPYSCKLTDEELRRALEELVSSLGYEATVHIERE